MLNYKMQKIWMPFSMSLIILIFTLILFLLDINNFLTTIFSIISVCYIPGYSLLKKIHLELESYETFFVSIILSLSILLLISIWLSITLFYITFRSIFFLIFFFVLLCTFNLHDISTYVRYEDMYNIYKNIKENKTMLFIIIITVFSPIVLLQSNILRFKYFLGYDPYRNEPIITLINEFKLNPIGVLNKRSIVFSGHSFFILALHASTNISVYNIVRFGGLFYLSLVCIIIFLIMYRIENSKWVAIIPFFYMTNNFVCNRFVMTIRENYSYVFFIFLIYLLIVYSKDNNKPKNIFILLGLTCATIITTHPLTLLFTLFIMLYYYIIKKDIMFLYTAIFSIIIVLPIMFVFIPWFKNTLIIQIQKILGIEITLPYWRAGSSSSKWGRDILLNDFSILEIILLPLSIICILRKKCHPYLHLFYIIPILSISMIIYILAKLGLNFTPARLNIYMSLPLSAASGLGLIEGINIFTSKLPKIKIKFILGGLKKTINNINNIVAIFIIIMPIVVLNSLTPLTLNKWCPYETEQVQAAQWIARYISNSTNELVIAPSNDMGVLEYAGLDPLYNQREIIEQILSTNTIEDFIKKAHAEYPSIKTLYIFMNNKWITLYRSKYKIINILESRFHIYHFKGATIIKAPLELR